MSRSKTAKSINEHHHGFGDDKDREKGIDIRKNENVR
jgi:hypothetical protein